MPTLTAASLFQPRILPALALLAVLAMMVLPVPSWPPHIGAPLGRAGFRGGWSPRRKTF